jgi:hypothetical protein
MGHACTVTWQGERARQGPAPPVSMDETAAQVHRTTVLPSLKPSVCSAKPLLLSTTLQARPSGAVSQVTRRASRKPVRQQAADRPKQAPACAHAHWHASYRTGCNLQAGMRWLKSDTAACMHALER